MQLHPAFHLVMVPWAPRLPRRRPPGSVMSRTSSSCIRVHGGPGISPRDSQRRTTGGETLHDLLYVPQSAGDLWPAGSGNVERLVGYISPVETLRMLPSWSLNQTAFSESPIEATPSFHSTPSISNV